MREIHLLLLAVLASLFSPLARSSDPPPRPLLVLDACFEPPPIFRAGMLTDDLGAVLTYLLLYNHQTCVRGGTDWHLQLCGKVGEWFRWVSPARGETALDPTRERRRQALLRLADRVHADARTRRALVRELAAYARRCKLARQGRELLDAFERALAEYEARRQTPAVRGCTMTCSPRAHPRWGLGAWDRGWTEDCFQGCGWEYRQAFGDHALSRLIHRRVLQGIPVAEMRALAALARRELGR